jgi:hypothetical protein
MPADSTPTQPGGLHGLISESQGDRIRSLLAMESRLTRIEQAAKAASASCTHEDQLIWAAIEGLRTYLKEIRDQLGSTTAVSAQMEGMRHELEVVKSDRARMQGGWWAVSVISSVVAFAATFVVKSFMSG